MGSTGRTAATVGAALLLVVAVVAAGLAISRQSSTTGSADAGSRAPASTGASAVPVASTPAAQAAAARLLIGDTELVGKFRDLSRPLLILGTEPDPGRRVAVCMRVADALNESVPGDTLLVAIASLQDHDLAELAVDEVTARNDLLADCIARDAAATDADVEQVATLDTMFTDRLAQL